MKKARWLAIAVYGVVVLVVSLVLSGFQLHEFRQAKSEGWERAASRADLAAEWVDAVFNLSDTALDGLVELDRSPLLTLFAGSVNPVYEYLEFILGERRRRFPFLDELGLFDEQGRVIVTSTPVFPHGYHVGNHPHFQVFFQDSSLDESVSGLYWSAFANDYRLLHIRRLDAVAGLQSHFAVARLTPQVFDMALDRLTMTRGESLAVFDNDSRLVASRPSCQETLNCLAIGEIDNRPEIQSLIARGESRHRIRLTSSMDGVERLYSFTRVNGRPFVVASGESLDILLEGWWQRLWIRAGILLLVILLGGAALRHYLVRLRLEQSARIVATVFEGHQGMLVADHKRRIVRVNQAFSRITGYSEEEVIGRDLSLLASGQNDETFYQAMCRSLAREGSWEGEVWSRRRSGGIYPERLAISEVQDTSARITHYVATFSDISEQKAIEEEALQLAFFDPLTGLPNRRRLLGKLDELAEEGRQGGHFAALLIIGLDHFMRVNDLSGHQAGDQLLQQFAMEMRQQLRASDTLARFGGDKFAVLLEGLGPDMEHAAYIVQSIAAKLLGGLPSLPEGRNTVQVTASIGISLFRLDRFSAQTVLQEGEMALQQAKQNGRNCCYFFDPVQQAQLKEQLKLETDLRHALAAGQFRLHYQPQVDTEGLILGAEVLLRWQHPSRGMVSPAEFIPLAEANRQIIAIDRWVLASACRQLVEWEKSKDLRELTLAVNISAQHFHEADLLPRLREMLVETGAPPSRLKLEVTEGLFLEHQEEARQKMLALKALGISFALDDFGTGFSSLSYLHRLPLDQLKIDQSFVQEMLDDSASATIVASTIDLAHNLNLEVIAEGVETEKQVEWLTAHGCRHFQGYLFGRPAPVKAIEQAIAKYRGDFDRE